MSGLTFISTDRDSSPTIPSSAFDLVGFRRWVLSPEFPEKLRASYIAGEIEVDMSPEEAFSHNSPKTAVTLAIGNWVEAYDLGEIFLNGMLLVNEEAQIANEPDLMFCRWETFSSGRVELRETKPGSGRSMELVGTPELVVEIMSESSVRKDDVQLKERYAVARIPEYWLIDCRSKAIRFDVLTLRRRKYKLVKPDASGASHSELLDAAVQLTRTSTRVNTWRYRLVIQYLSKADATC